MAALETTLGALTEEMCALKADRDSYVRFIPPYVSFDSLFFSATPPRSASVSLMNTVTRPGRKINL